MKDYGRVFYSLPQTNPDQYLARPKGAAHLLNPSINIPRVFGRTQPCSDRGPVKKLLYRSISPIFVPLKSHPVGNGPPSLLLLRSSRTRARLSFHVGGTVPVKLLELQKHCKLTLVSGKQATGVLRMRCVQHVVQPLYIMRNLCSA